MFCNLQLIRYKLKENCFILTILSIFTGAGPKSDNLIKDSNHTLVALSMGRNMDHLQERLENFYKFYLTYHKDEIILSQALAPWQIVQPVPPEEFKEHKADMKKLRQLFNY